MRLKKFNNYHKVEEGWKQNLLLSLSLLISTPTFSNKIHKVDQMEQSTDYTKDFWKACFQVCEDLKSPKMSIEERAGILEAQIYFQSKRDGTKYDKLSNRGVVVSKIVM